MARNNKSLIMAAAALGVLALLLTLYVVTRPPADPTPLTATGAPAPAPTPQGVVQYVASRDIPPRTLITRAMLREIPDAKPIPGAISDPQQVVGQISRRPIRAEQTITDDVVTQSLQRVVPANFVVPEGLRAVAVYVDPSSTAAGLVDVGDRVDVIVNHQLKADKQPTERYEQVVQGATEYTVGRTIAQDILVLAVDRSLSNQPTPTPTPAVQSGADNVGAPPAPPPPPGATATPQPAAGIKTRVILATTPQTAERLVAANDRGVIHLTIRNPNSREQFPIPGVIEYPSRVVNIPKRQPQTGGGGGGGGGGGRIAVAPQPLPDFNPRPTFQETAPARIPQSSPPIGTGQAIETAPSGSEVTVIRGTEKTRVLVPSR